MNSKKDSGRISVRLPLELKTRLEKVAEKRERSYGWVVQKCLEKLIKDLEQEAPKPFERAGYRRDQTQELSAAA